MVRVVAAENQEVRRFLHDFRVEEHGEWFVARLQGEGRFGSAVFPELSQKKKILIELLHWDEWLATRPKIFERWLTALRLPYLAFTLLPILLVAFTLVAENGFEQIRHVLWMVVSVSLLHLGCNLWNDYEDHLRGVDAPDSSGGSGVIRNLWIPAVHIRNAAAILFFAGLVCGIFLLKDIGWATGGKHLLWIGMLGALAAASYSGWPFHYKYLGLGEPIVFLISPLVAMGACAVLYRDADYFVWFAIATLPLAFLAILRLHIGNMQRIPFDKLADTRTIASLVGFKRAKWIGGFLLIAPFLITVAMWALKVAPAYSLASFAAVPWLISPALGLVRAKGPLDPECQRVRTGAAILHLVFGVLYTLGFLF